MSWTDALNGLAKVKMAASMREGWHALECDLFEGDECTCGAAENEALNLTGILEIERAIGEKVRVSVTKKPLQALVSADLE